MEISEVTEVFEITDSSINIENIADKTAIESSKRRYSPDLDESVELTSKKFREEKPKDDSETYGNDITESIDAAKNESEILDSSQEVEEEVIEDPNETSVLDKTTESETMLEELVSDGEDKNNEDDVEDDVVEDNGQVIDSEDSEIEEEVEEEEEEEESEGHTSDEESDDDALMMRAMNASKTAKVSNFSNDEPIALDSDSEMSEGEDAEDGDDSKIYETTNYERNNSFPYDYRTRMLRFSPRYYLARKLVKKSIKIINAKLAEKKKIEKSLKEPEKVEIVENVVEPEIITESKIVEAKPIEVPQENVQQELPKEQTEEPSKVEEPMQVDESPSKHENKSSEVLPKEVSEEKSTSEQKTNEVKTDSKIQQNSSNSDNSSEVKATQGDQEMEETSFLLTEILKNSIDDIMNRYVFNNTENNQQSGVPVAMEDFAEKLFICLQQNKHDIQKAQQIWNEKLHIKYKIREMMERIRRHRAVVDIESFGYKPTHDNPIISSKSSTTNSEIDHFDKASRMSTESVSRLIQDVRANVLKREEQKRIENHINVNDSAYDDSNPFSQLQNLQNSSNQGRQGQIIDVQSIINDFRQKHPQEIPRRGRRFKNSFGVQGMESPYSRMDINARNESYKSNSSQGFPEVSLLPVNSFYKNLPQASGSSSFGQKSSLLQSILTKSTKSPIGVQQMNNSSGTSSTLARLLTAPERERTLQNTTPRQMNMGGSSRQSNGEITITPIQPGTSRKQDYSMEDDETSTDGHLVIDESDFDMSDRKSDLLLCQGCRRHKALFMCAGCSKQWYCSKECQELAWDDHAESCMV